MLWMLLILSQGVEAGPDGREFLYAEFDDQPDQSSALNVSLELERRMQELQRLESELGHYNASLIEKYGDLARFLEEHGDHQQAAEMYRQALQLARINTGLHSEQQLPFIDRIIGSSLSLNDWQQVDDMHHFRYYLKNRIYDPADPRFAEAIAELGNWKLRVMRENLLNAGSRGITDEAEKLSKVYQDGITRIQSSPEFNETSLLPLYQGKSMADLAISQVLADTPYQYFQGTVSRFVYQSVCRNVPGPRGESVRQCTQVKQENPRYRQSQRDNKRMMVNRSVREVQKSIDNLNGILVRNPEIPAGERNQIASQIREFEVEFQRILRSSRRGLLF